MNISLFRTIKNLWRGRTERGQSLIILTFVFLGLLAMLGLALDLGLVYVNRVNLKRAVDAASLAAATDLPIEEQAINRAIEFLEENGYPQSNIYVAGCIQDVNDVFGEGPEAMVNTPFFEDDFYSGLETYALTETLTIDNDLFYLYQDPTADGVADAGYPSFYIDTRSFQIRTRNTDGSASGQTPNCGNNEDLPLAQVTDDGISYGSASKIRVYGRIPVRMNFMQFFGFDEVDVSDEAIAQNSANLDVVVVMDVTGSMAFDTICEDCWRRCDQTSDCSSNDKYKRYPENGRAYPYDYFDIADPYICGNGGDCTTSPPTPGQPKPEGSNDYIILEAELYSNNTSVWDPAFRGAGVGYWAMQRNSGYSVDGDGTHIRHHPYVEVSDSGKEFGHHYTLAEAQSGVAPRVEYDFIPTWDDTTFIYARVRAFNDGRNIHPRNTIYWGVDNSGPYTDETAIYDNWTWLKWDAGVLTKDTTHVVKLWAGSAGYRVDRIIVTRRNDVSGIDNDSATPGTAQRLAADPCNPIYGLQVLASDCTYMTLMNPSVNNLYDPLFGDTQPIRGAKEAIRSFVERLDPELDQAGFVTFNTTAYQQAQLECLLAAEQRAKSRPQINNYPIDSSVLGVEFDETVCADPEEAAPGTVPIEFQNVLIAIENASDSGGTDIADGMRRGLNMMAVSTHGQDHPDDCAWTKSGSTWEIGGQTQPDTDIDSHCTRKQAATRVIVLLTDGAPNDNSPGDNNECRTWSGDPYPGMLESEQSHPQYKCILYYTDIARTQGIIIYTIGLGVGADPKLLGAVAERTNGEYYFAPSAAQLNIIFNQILANIYVRLIK